MRKPIYILLALTFVSCVNSYVHPCEEELIRLDRTLDNMDEYVTIKDSRIAAISETLEDPQLTPVQRYAVYGRLYEEYLPYQFDKAFEMLRMQEDIALEMGDMSLKTTASLNKAFLFTTSGLFHEASLAFGQLDTLTFDYQQKMLWYNARQKFLKDYEEYLRTSGIDVPDIGKIRSYQNLILENTPENSILNRHITIMHMIWDNRWEEAYDENLRVIEGLNPHSRDYAVQTYWQGFICENLKRDD